MNTAVIEERVRRSTTRRRKAAAVLFAAALVAAPVAAQRHAQPRSGSSSGSSSSHGSSSGSYSHSGSSSSGTAHRVPSSRGSAPHRPTGSRRDGGYHGRGYYPGHSYYYPRFGLSFGYSWPYYSPYYWGGYYGYYGGPWGYYPPYYGYGYGYGYPPPRAGSYDRRSDLGAVQLKVKPKTAEVYVDGRFVGTAGSFDGYPGYLWLEPGVHELALVQNGYANLEREIEITPGQVLEYKLRLEPGVAEWPEPGGDYDRPSPDQGRPDYPAPGEQPGRQPSLERRDTRQSELRFEVEPDDASVYLDGHFIGTGEEVSSADQPLEVEPGRHTLQVVHPDFRTEERSIEVRPGEQKLMAVMLRRAGGI